MRDMRPAVFAGTERTFSAIDSNSAHNLTQNLEQISTDLIMIKTRITLLPTQCYDPLSSNI